VSYALRFTFYALLFALLFSAASLVSAQTGEVTDDEVNEVAKDLYCPVCESTPLDVCPTQACADWRDLIRQQLAEGKTKAEVHEYFARQYGDGVLADPPKRGFNLILWLFPITAVLLGGGLFLRYMKRLQRDDEVLMETAVPTPPPQPAIIPTAAKPEYIAQIEEELLAKKL
jgi:cytochrome c-type biogenesis protein CcmH